MLDVQQYYCAQPRLQALHLNENSRSILEKMGEKTSKKDKKRTGFEEKSGKNEKKVKKRRKKCIVF